MGEANVPAEHPEAGQEPRVPAPHVDACRPGDTEGTAGEGPAQAVGLIGRLGDRAGFARLRAEGRRTRAGAVTVTFAPGAPDGSARVAYAIGRRVGGAVVRNRVRRRLRAIVAQLDPPPRPGDYLIGVGPAAAEASFGELRTMVCEALRKAGR